LADYLKIPEVARRLDVSEPTVRRMVKGGKLPSVFVGGAYRVSEADLAEFLENAKVEPGKGEAPPSPEQPNFNGLLEEERREPKPPEPPGHGPPRWTQDKTTEEFERALARFLEPVRAEALQEQQAANRVLASQGERQDRVVDLAEAEAGKRFLEEFPPDERPVALGIVALGYARLERDNANLREALTQTQAALEERGQGAQEPADTVHSTNG
jgi:excisionase family DNA binding protein